MDLGLIIVAVALPLSVALSFRFGPKMLLFGMCAVMPFPVSIGGEIMSGNISPADCFAAITSLYLVHRIVQRKTLKLGPAGFPLLLFLAAATISSLKFAADLGTIVSLARMLLGTFVAMIIFANFDNPVVTARQSFEAYLVGVCILGCCSAFAFAIGGFRSSEYVFGINKNGLGPIFGCGIAIAMSFLMLNGEVGRRRSWIVVALVCSVVGSLLALSRGGWIATLVACLFLLFRTGRVKVFTFAVLFLVPIVWATWTLLPEDATQYATDVSPDAFVIRSRFDAMEVVMKEFNRDPLLGAGIGLRKYGDPHNVLILTLGEMGIVGLVTFVFAFGAGFYTLHKAWRRGQGNRTANLIVAAATAVFLVTTVHGMMDVYWRRGVGFLGWAGVGMAASILCLTKAEAQPVQVTSIPRRARPMRGGAPAT